MNIKFLKAAATCTALWLTACATTPSGPAVQIVTPNPACAMPTDLSILGGKTCDMQSTFKIDADGMPFDYAVAKPCQDHPNRKVIEQAVQQKVLANCRFPKVGKQTARYSNLLQHLSTVPQIMKLNANIAGVGQAMLTCPEPIIPAQMQAAGITCPVNFNISFSSTKVKSVKSEAACSEPWKKMANQAIVKTFSACKVDSAKKFNSAQIKGNAVFAPD